MKNLKKAALCLMALVITISVSVPVITLARNTSHTEKASSVKVAAFAASLNGSVSDLSIDCNKGEREAKFQVEVSNRENGKTAQTDLSYELVLTGQDPIPSEVKITADGHTGTVSADGRTITFRDAGWTFRAGKTASRQHTICFAVDLNTQNHDLRLESLSISSVFNQTR